MKKFASPSWHFVAVNRNPNRLRLTWDGEVPFIRWTAQAMNHSAKFVIETSSFATRNSSANVTGVIYLQVGDRAFPDSRWSDFPVIILGWWLEGLTQMVRGHTSEFEALFMDGPYKFSVKQLDGMAAQITLHEASNDWTKNVTLSDLYASLAMTAAAAVLECQTRGWSNSDLTELARSVAAAAA